MRADRLISILIMLQTNGRMTARELAEELEVSERTIYRDMVALSTAGVPVYTEKGPGGGCRLVESYRTDLTGLSKDELQALYMISIPAPLAELGIGQELRAALLKLSAALPDSSREKNRVRQRIHLDSSWWFQTDEPHHFLKVIQQAVWEDRKLEITHRGEIKDMHLTRTVDAYSLVAKAGVWYFVWGNEEQVNAMPISWIVSAEILDEQFNRPKNFDLSDFWTQWAQEYENNRPCYLVQLRISPQLAPFLPAMFDEHAAAIIQASLDKKPKQWIEIELDFGYFQRALRYVLSWGGAVEVLAPLALRDSVVDFSHQILTIYKER